MKSSANVIGKALFANLTDSSDSGGVCLSKNTDGSENDTNSFIMKTMVRTTTIKEPHIKTTDKKPACEKIAELTEEMKKETDKNTS